MCDIPLELQRKFEQRWAARFSRSAPTAAPQRLRPASQQPATPAKAKEKRRRQGERMAVGLVVGRAVAEGPA
jgi:hypothetical protein